MRNIILPLLAAFFSTAFFAAQSGAYPEFQTFSEKQSGRSVNCAMCHTSPDGPVGEGEGQIGGLSARELERLNQARTALEPGAEVNNPILNEFGNKIIKKLGKAQFVEMRKNPEQLAAALGTDSDIDHDGIPDGVEFNDGTDPLDKLHGDPGKLFVANVSKYRFDLALALVATATIVFGLTRLVRSLM